jgi:RNA polymerase sigma-70 factor (ECF subfamily)
MQTLSLQTNSLYGNILNSLELFRLTAKAAVKSIAAAATMPVRIIFDAVSNGEAAKTAESEAAAVRAGVLLDKYGDSILRVAYLYLHNMSDAEDILQDTLIQYIRKSPEFENENHEKAWLLTVAANLSKNKIEYLNIRKADELSEELVSENKEDLAFVWDAVKQLPEKYREVIHLFYQEGYSTKDIAGILKRKEATVRSDLNRGRQQLKNILKEAYDFE